MALAERALNLRVDEYGLWSSGKAAAVSYPEQGHERCYALEDDSFWFRHRGDCILALVRRFPPDGPVLDVGGGNGYMTQRLIEAGFDAALLEPGLTGALNAKRHRQIPEVICATLEDAGFPAESIGAVGLFDVLEHVDGDRTFLEKLGSALRPGGLVYGTVPAHRFLWSASDVKALHFRRYDRDTVKRLLAGRFDLVYFTYLFRALTLPLLLFRTLPYRFSGDRAVNPLEPETEHGKRGGLAVTVLRRLLAGEVRRIERGDPMAFGTSCLFAARKRALGGCLHDV